MGFSLVGNSGDQKTTTNVTETDYTASINPQIDQEGASPGDVALNISPNYQGSYGDTTANVSSNFAPINITSTGDNLGDQALAALQGLVATQTADTAPSAAASGSTPTTLSSLLSGNTLYWILGAIVVLFLAHQKR